MLRFVDYAGPSKTLFLQATTFFITMTDDVVGVAHSSSDGLLESEDDDDDDDDEDESSSPCSSESSTGVGATPVLASVEEAEEVLG